MQALTGQRQSGGVSSHACMLIRQTNSPGTIILYYHVLDGFI
jgi:hypothetical protein